MVVVKDAMTVASKVVPKGDQMAASKAASTVALKVASTAVVKVEKRAPQWAVSSAAYWEKYSVASTVDKLAEQTDRKMVH